MKKASVLNSVSNKSSKIDTSTNLAGDHVEVKLAILKKLRIVIRAAQQHSLWIEKQCGVNGAQLWIMQELLECRNLRVGELAQKLAIHQTTASNLLDALEKRGYISKTRDATDQRVVRINLTSKARACCSKRPNRHVGCCQRRSDTWMKQR